MRCRYGGIDIYTGGQAILVVDSDTPLQNQLCSLLPYPSSKVRWLRGLTRRSRRKGTLFRYMFSLHCSTTDSSDKLRTCFSIVEKDKSGIITRPVLTENRHDWIDY